MSTLTNGYRVISCLRMDITGHMMIVESRDFICGKSLIYPPHSFEYLRCIPLFSILRYFYFLKLVDKNMIWSFEKPVETRLFFFIAFMQFLMFLPWLFLLYFPLWFLHFLYVFLPPLCFQTPQWIYAIFHMQNQGRITSV